jgi:hypothetical protein
MFQASTLMWSILFGAFGMGYLAYARRQRDPIALIAGVGLCAYTFFVSNVYAMVGVGVALIALPMVVKRLG